MLQYCIHARRFRVAIGVAALVFGSAQGQSWVEQGQPRDQWAKTLAAQRRELEEIKQIFARIDARIVKIEKIHRKIESILANPEAVVACVALDEIEKTKTQLSADYSAAVNDSDRSRIKKDLDIYESMFKKAAEASDRLRCREQTDE